MYSFTLSEGTSCWKGTDFLFLRFFFWIILFMQLVYRVKYRNRIDLFNNRNSVLRIRRIWKVFVYHPPTKEDLPGEQYLLSRFVGD